jgi:hypothetical protein
MQMFRIINSALAFFVEIAMVVALGWSGYQVANYRPVQYVLLIALPLFAIIIWSIWAAPRSARRLQRPWLNIFKLLLFSATVILLYKTNHLAAAITFGTVAFVNELLAACPLNN